MENEIQPNTPLIQPAPQVTSPITPLTKSTKLLPLILLGLIIVAVSVYVGVQIGKNQIPPKESIVVEPTLTLTPSSSPTPTVSIVSGISDWETYQDKYLSIKYPKGWRYVMGEIGGGYNVGFGPQEVAEDVIWGVTISSKTGPGSTTLEKIKDSMGKQFPDRVQKQTSTEINGMQAIVVTTTTPSIPDWFLESVIVERDDGFTQISNGAIKDKELQNKYGYSADVNFENFYKSLKFAINR